MSVDKDGDVWGYSIGANISEQDFGLSTGLNYQLNKSIRLSGRMGLSLQGSLDQSLEVNYSFS